MSKKSWFDIKAAAKGKRARVDIYNEIGAWGITAKDFIDELREAGDPDEIDLHLNSPGGSVFDGIAIYNSLKSHRAKVTAHIDGVAASMASVIAMAADKIQIAENGFLMIHNPWGWARGDADEMRKQAELMDKIKSAMLLAYARSGKTDDEISKLMDDETWYTGAEAVAAGFADETTPAIELAASFDPEILGYRNAPRALFTTQAQEIKPMPTEKTQGAAPVDQKQQFDAEAVRAQALQSEKQRRTEIRAVFSGWDQQHGAELNACLDDPAVDVHAARERLLSAMAKQVHNKPLAGEVVEIKGEREKNREGIEIAIMARAGLIKKPDLRNNEFRGMTLAEMARHCVRDSVAAGSDRMQIVGSAFTHTTSDFPNVLANVLNKSMLMGWEEAPETFEAWTRKGVLTDFRAAKRVGLNLAPNLAEIPEGAEYTYGTIGGRGEDIQLATYGRLLSITRQAVINDDLQSFSDLPRKMGRAARRTIGNLVYAVLTSNPLMADGVALFHTASHGNLASAGAAPSTTTFDAARTAMGRQTDGTITGQPLNIRPRYVLVPLTLEGASRVVVASDFEVSGSKNLTVPNSVKGMVEVIADGRLDGNSTTAYYFAADPMLHDTIEVAYLDGNDAPYLEIQQGWNVDGTAFKVRIDAGVKALDYRTMYKNPGV